MRLEIAFIRETEDEIVIIQEDFERFSKWYPPLKMTLNPTTELRTQGASLGELFYHLEVSLLLPAHWPAQKLVGLVTMFRGLSDIHSCNIFSLYD